MPAPPSRRVLRVTWPLAGLMAAALALSGCGLATPDTVISASTGPGTSPAAGSSGSVSETPGTRQSTDLGSASQATEGSVGGSVEPESSANGSPGSGSREPDGSGSGTPKPESSTAAAPGTRTGGAGGDSAPATDTRATATQSSSTGLAGVSVSPAQAAATAMAAHRGSAVIAISLDRAHGRTVWQVAVVSTDGRWGVDVDITSGAIVGDRPDDPEDRAHDLKQLARARLDHRQAIAAALAVHPSSSLVEITLDSDDGALVWEAEIVTADHRKFDISIDAGTGAVLANEPDD